MAPASLATADARNALRLPSWLRYWDAARLAIATVFLADGLAFGTWVVQLPLLKHGLGLSDLAFAAVLAGLVGGAFVAMLLAGRLGGSLAPVAAFGALITLGAGTVLRSR